MQPVTLSQKDFKIYEGKYFSDETNSFIIIQHDSSRLIIHLNANKAYQLKPTYIDNFEIDELGNVQFIRNAQNEIEIIKFYLGRSRGIEFKKVEK